MWWIVALAVIALLVAALGMVVGPFLTLKRLPERVEINGMALVKDGFVSAAVVPLSDREVALVDAGNDVQARALLAELARRGLGPDDVKVILLTHGHSDHSGGIAKFAKAQVMALAEEVDVVEGRSTGGGPIMRFRSPKPTGIRLSRALHDGDVLQMGSFQVRVFAVPGHTPGSAAYAIGENLFLGDSANQGKQGRLEAAPWAFSESAAQNRKSLVELARCLANDSSIKTLVFSHSPPLQRGTAPLLEFAARVSTTPNPS
jgi:glyoxylase-like metal-dependent hydrolase (beta-lactamase superfamily II)